MPFVAIICALTTNFLKKIFRVKTKNIAKLQVNEQKDIDTPGWVEYVDKDSVAL